MGMQIQKNVTRQGSKLVLGFVGESGSGKTLSALYMALGMAKGNGTGEGAGRVGFIDTENGRSRLYSEDEVVKANGGFDMIELAAPYTPERFLEAIETFDEAGYPVVVVDTVSHEWNNTGGVIDQVDTDPGKSEFAKWNKPKKKHARFFNGALQAKCHLIFCYRAKEKLKQAKDEQGKSVIVSNGIQPIQDSAMIYDMTISFLFEKTFPRHIKVPKMLHQLFPQDQRITVQHGVNLSQWVAGGDPVNERFEELKREGTAAAIKGTDSLKAWFVALPSNGDRALIKVFVDDEAKSMARQADEDAKPEPSKGNDLTNMIMGAEEAPINA